MTFNLQVALDGDDYIGVHVAGVSDGGVVRSRPALVICPEVFGVNSHMRSVAERFAKDGFLTLVPDLFWRIEPGVEIAYDDAGLKRGSAILEVFDIDAAASDVARVIAAARAMPQCNGKVGVLGFCVGGTVAFVTAARADIDAAVGYYAKGVERYTGEAARLRCDVMLHYGDKDRFIPTVVVEQIRASIASTTTNHSVEIYRYADVDHGFNSNDRRAYDAAAAELAVSRTMALLNRALR